MRVHLASLLGGHPALGQADLCRGSISQNCGVAAICQACGVPAIPQAAIRKIAAHISCTHVRKAMLNPAHAGDHTCRAHVLFPGGCLPSHVWWQAAAEDARHHQEPVSRRPDCSSASSYSSSSSSSTSAGPFPCTWCGPSTRTGSPTGCCRISLVVFEMPVFQCCAV